MASSYAAFDKDQVGILPKLWFCILSLSQRTSIGF